jgi:hypothetical protein
MDHEPAAELGAWAAGGAGSRLLTADAMVGFVVSVYALMVAGGGELVDGVGPTDVPVPIAGS